MRSAQKMLRTQRFSQITMLCAMIFLATAIVAHTLAQAWLAETLGNVAFTFAAVATILLALDVKARNLPSAKAVTWLFVTFGPIDPSFGGTATRSAALRRALAQCGFECINIVVSSDLTNTTGSEKRTFFVRSRVAAWFTALRRFNEADAVLLGSAQFAPVALLAWLFSIDVVWEANACEYIGNKDAAKVSFGAERVKHTAYSYVWRILESVCGLVSSRVIITSERDREDWLSVYRFMASRLHVVPHLGANEPAVASLSDDSDYVRTLGLEPDKYVLFVGNLLAKHNRAATKILLGDGALRDALEGANVTLALAGDGTESIASDKGILALGRVDRIRPLIRCAILCVSPLPYAGGTPTKIIDYLHFGKALVCSMESLRGIDIDPSWPVTIAPPTATGAAVSQLLCNNGAMPDPSKMNAAVEECFGERVFQEAFRSAISKLIIVRQALC